MHIIFLLYLQAETRSVKISYILLLPPKSEVGNRSSDLPGERTLDLPGERELDLPGERVLDLPASGICDIHISSYLFPLDCSIVKLELRTACRMKALCLHSHSLLASSRLCMSLSHLFLQIRMSQNILKTSRSTNLK